MSNWPPKRPDFLTYKCTILPNGHYRDSQKHPYTSTRMKTTFTVQCSFIERFIECQSKQKGENLHFGYMPCGNNIFITNLTSVFWGVECHYSLHPFPL